MKRKSLLLRQDLIGLVAQHNATFNAVLLSAIFLVLAGTGCEQPEMAKVQLRSRTFTPKRGIVPEYYKTLEDALERRQKRHVYVQLKKHLDKSERTQLERQGVKLLNYIGSKTWHATVSDPKVLEFTSSAAIRRTPTLGTVQWLGEIKSQDKIEPKIRTKGVGDYNRQPDGQVDVIVVFFPDVSKNSLGAVVKRHGRMMREPGMLNDVVVRLNEANIKELSQEDAVQWIEEVGPPPEDFNDGSRACINVDVLQIAPYNLDGSNVQVGQWETGNPDKDHDDLTGRITVVEVGILTSHAIHVAGTLGGDGSRSAAEGGTANQWRGMADAANVFSFTAAGTPPEEHEDAIKVNGIDISTNSWGYSENFGDYRDDSVKYDRIVRGLYGRAIPLVFAAGNSGPNFDRICPNGATAKNTITVGGINSNDNSNYDLSSRGPTTNSQTKPDVVAAGCEVGGDNGVTSTVSTDTYDQKCGTSMAAPAVSGTVSLMLQQYRQTYFGDDTRDEAPLPSTFKVILCHTAEDLIDNPEAGADLVGPDYVYGYGLVNAEEAVNAIRNARFLEGVIHSSTDEDIYEFDVAAGEDELKVTLAWDDVAGTAGAADILQNDLDLVLINPAGNAFYPPWELDPANPENPADRNSYGTEAAAAGHCDEHNVVEQVVVDNPAAGTWTIKVKTSDLPEPYQRYSIIAGDQDDDRLGGQVDIMQVLDRSGSMGGYASSSSTDTKINVLKQAASHFIELMKPNVGNQLGLVQFNQDVVDFDPTFDADPDLSILTGERAQDLIDETVPSIVHGGSTSIGDGLNEAMIQLTGAAAVAEHDQVILLVTDGKENWDLRIEDVDDALIAANIAVYPLGLGYGSGINEEKLTDLADATGGTFRITSDELIFRKFFIEILAGAVDWAVVVEPVGELGQGESITVPVAICADETSATFTAYWERFDDAVNFTLISPSNNEITPTMAASNSQIRFGKHPRYAFYQLDFPLDGSLAGEWSGQWRMKLTGTGQISSGKARYSASAFAEGGTKLDVSLGKIAHLAGNAIPVQVRLTKNGKPLIGAQIDVYCNAPAVSAANLLSRSQITLDELKKVRPITKDPVSLIDQKLQILTKKAGKDILPRKTTKFRLFDDGKHRDRKARDGIYAANFTNNRIPGSYTFRIVASKIPGCGKLTTTREWTTSIYNRVNINPKYSQIDVKMVDKTTDGWLYRVKIIPKDPFNNYLGPGHRVRVSISSRFGKRQIELKDNIDGTYTKDILIRTQELKAGVKLSIDIDGKKFADVKKTIGRP